MTLQHRIDLLVALGKYIQNNSSEWQLVKQNAYRSNPWFLPEFINMASDNVAVQFLQKEKLENWVKVYQIPHVITNPHVVGIVMAGNLPMVGFHDMLCAFISGHKQHIKLSSKDDVLIKHLIEVMTDLYPQLSDYITISDNLKGCDAYIATGSNNSGRYFEYYFGKFPHIIRRNKTSVAVLDGTETIEELGLLADDIQTFFGLGCRNVTKLFVPEQYNFEPLLKVLKKYDYYADFHKYKNNYDYQLALLMMGNKYYMTNESIILSENESVFTAVSHVHYSLYEPTNPQSLLLENDDIQCIVGHNHVPFGEAQRPRLTDYADGVDTLQFLISL